MLERKPVFPFGDVVYLFGVSLLSKSKTVLVKTFENGEREEKKRKKEEGRRKEEVFFPSFFSFFPGSHL